MGSISVFSFRTVQAPPNMTAAMSTDGSIAALGSSRNVCADEQWHWSRGHTCVVRPRPGERRPNEGRATPFATSRRTRALQHFAQFTRACANHPRMRKRLRLARREHSMLACSASSGRSLRTSAELTHTSLVSPTGLAYEPAFGTGS